MLDSRIVRVLLGSSLVVAGVVGALAIRAWYEKRSLRVTELHGRQIVSALVSYRKTHDYYPFALDELVPDFLPEVPRATWGDQRWRYSTLTTDRFQIHVCGGAGCYPKLYYQNGWFMDDF